MPSKRNKPSVPPCKREAQGEIAKPKVPSPSVVFCFKFLDAKHKTFSLDRLPKKFCKTLLERLREYGRLDFSDFAPPAGDGGLHSHRAERERIEAHGGFKNVPDDLWRERPWQFSIQGKRRAIGFLLRQVFHVVWIDSDHKFDPGKGR